MPYVAPTRSPSTCHGPVGPMGALGVRASRAWPDSLCLCHTARLTVYSEKATFESRTGPTSFDAWSSRCRQVERPPCPLALHPRVCGEGMLVAHGLLVRHEQGGTDLVRHMMVIRGRSENFLFWTYTQPTPMRHPRPSGRSANVLYEAARPVYGPVTEPAWQ